MGYYSNENRGNVIRNVPLGGIVNEAPLLEGWSCLLLDEGSTLNKTC
jgi:hypothetical protein